jgi:ankyrin repeat protein
MSNNFWNSLTVEINQLFEKQEDQTIQKTEEIEETTESYKCHTASESYKFYTACNTGNVELVNTYLENGHDPCEYSNSAIRIACETGCISVVDRLLQDKRINTSNIVNSALYKACKNGHIELVDLLLQYNTQMNLSNKIDYFSKTHYQKSIVDRLQQEIQNREKSNQ